MKLINMVVLFIFCSSLVFAETTLELIQQRAESGDATAQTFLGMAYQYGYSVTPDSEKALEWFGKAAEQGDVFAAKRRDLWGQPIRTTVRTVTDSRLIPQEELEKKVVRGESAAYAGKVKFDELVLHRDQYVDKVVQLDFTTLSVVGGSVPYIYVRDPRSQPGQSGASERLYLCGESALKWRLEVERKYPGAVSTICALVEKDGLVAIGLRNRKTDNGYTYSW
jgi:hypothetical protein